MYVDLPKEGQYPKPTPLKPSSALPRVNLSFWPSGPSFPGAWLLSWGSSGLRGLDSARDRLKKPPRSLAGAQGSWRKPLCRSTTKVGIYGPALNPKRWKFGWPPASRQVGGKEECWPSPWAQPLQRLHPPPSITLICRHPHTLQVCWWRHPSMRD